VEAGEVVALERVEGSGGEWRGVEESGGEWRGVEGSGGEWRGLRYLPAWDKHQTVPEQR
jgi:hypothetical protein